MKLHYCFSENALQGTPRAKIWLGSIVHGLTWANIMVHKVVHGWSWACSFLRILSVLHPASQYFDDIHPDVEEVQTHHFIVVADDNISSLFCIDDLASEITNFYQADCPTCTYSATRPCASFVSIWNIDVDEELNMLRWWALSLAVNFVIAFPTSIVIVHWLISVTFGSLPCHYVVERFVCQTHQFQCSVRIGGLSMDMFAAANV